MHIPAIRTAVRAHSENRWVRFLEGIDAQKAFLVNSLQNNFDFYKHVADMSGVKSAPSNKIPLLPHLIGEIHQVQVYLIQEKQRKR